MAGRADRRHRRNKDRVAPLIAAVLLDAGGTLLHPAEPVGRTYARIARDFGIEIDEHEVQRRFRAAFASPWPGRRYDGDGKPFWSWVVRQVLGDERAFDALYTHYAAAPAWRVAADAVEALDVLGDRGIRRAVVSNWDVRLRPLLRELGLERRLDAVVVSGEVGAEKPDPAIFALACAQLGVPSHAVVHVGDDPELDVAAARAAGCAAWLWGTEISTFGELTRRLACEPEPPPSGDRS